MIRQLYCDTVYIYRKPTHKKKKNDNYVFEIFLVFLLSITHVRTSVNILFNDFYFLFFGFLIFNAIPPLFNAIPILQYC